MLPRSAGLTLTEQEVWAMRNFAASATAERRLIHCSDDRPNDAGQLPGLYN